MIKINRVIWEDWNINHIAKHNVIQGEVEEVLHSKFVICPSYRDRILITGKTSRDRFITIIAHEEVKNVYYIITARDATEPEIKEYEEQINAQNFRKKGSNS